MILSQRIGDSKTHSIPLSWNGRPFAPGNAWLLLFTVKSSPDTQNDAAAAFQKSTGGGITVSGTKASVEILPINTAGGTVEEVVVPALLPGTYYWDIQATRDVDGEGESRTVASGTMTLVRDVSRLSEPTLDVYSVAPPFLYFSYQSYLATNPPAPVLTEEQWVSRLGTSNPDIVATYPPLPSNDNREVGRTFAVPYEGLQWFDPSDGATSVWMWFDPDDTNDHESYGVFVSQFPTPVSGEIPANAIADGETGQVFTDDLSNYLTLTE